jgi:hypothetical protein
MPFQEARTRNGHENQSVMKTNPNYPCTQKCRMKREKNSKHENRSNKFVKPFSETFYFSVMLSAVHVNRKTKRKY